MKTHFPLIKFIGIGAKPAQKLCIIVHWKEQLKKLYSHWNLESSDTTVRKCFSCFTMSISANYKLRWTRFIGREDSFYGFYFKSPKKWKMIYNSSERSRCYSFSLLLGFATFLCKIVDYSLSVWHHLHCSFCFRLLFRIMTRSWLLTRVRCYLSHLFFFRDLSCFLVCLFTFYIIVQFYTPSCIV